MRHLLLFIIGIYLSGGLVSGQKLILDQKVEPYPPKDLFGPNHKHFLEARVFYGFMNIWENNSYPLKFLGTGEFETKIRYKFKLNSFLSTGLSASYNNQQFERDNNNLPDSLYNDKEVFKTNSIKPAIFLRINLDPKRGNYLGKYIEGGFYGSWSFSVKRELINYYDNDINSEISKSREIQSGLNYLNRINYGSYISIGSGNYELTYSHRMSDFFNENMHPKDPRIDYELADFPRNTLGFSIRLNF